MTGLHGDDLTAALVPLASDLVSAVHAMNATVVGDILEHAAALAGDDPLTGAQHLAVLCAAMASEDHTTNASLGWTANPPEYRRLRDTCDALTASLRAGMTPTQPNPEPEGATA